jgi:hypothetical protein
MRFEQKITVGHQYGVPTGTVYQGVLIDSDNYEQTIELASGERMTISRQHMIKSEPVRVS